ncbi:MAG TPA: GPW/gp25 family protein [Actinomycetes bacterium]|nr:GPW/gp25 family protein [Actinomycetes bacterium]
MSNGLPDTAPGFLGRGWDFPLGLDAGGQIQRTPGPDEGIRKSIWTILSTAPGERVMRPDFGCGIHDLVFGVNDARTASAVTGAVRSALARWEPRVDVLDVYAAPDASRPNLLLVEINYQIRSDNSRSNLVYPFYLD